MTSHSPGSPALCRPVARSVIAFSPSVARLDLVKSRLFVPAAACLALIGASLVMDIAWIGWFAAGLAAGYSLSGSV